MAKNTEQRVRVLEAEIAEFLRRNLALQATLDRHVEAVASTVHILSVAVLGAPRAAAIRDAEGES